MSSNLGPSVALLGLFDLPDYGALLTARIVERELRRRLPLARVDLYAPLGKRRPTTLDGGRPALPLGPPEPSRKAELAARYDLVVVTGEVIHTRDDVYADLYGISQGEAERLRPSGFFVDGLTSHCPVAWHHVGVPFELDGDGVERVRGALKSTQHVSVHDELSRERLLAASSGSEIDVVPDPPVLADRVFPADVLRKRLGYLRAMGWYPSETPPAVVEGDAAGDLTELEGPIVVLGETGVPLSDGVFRLPAQLSLEDIVAAIAHARIFVAGSAAGRATALAFDVPSSPSGDEELRAEVRRRMDAEFDALAGLSEAAWSERAAREDTAASLRHDLGHANERYEALLRAYEERGERLVQERLRFAEIVEGLETAASGLSAEVVARAAELESRLEIAFAAEAEARFELERLRAERDAQPDG